MASCRCASVSIERPPLRISSCPSSTMPSATWERSIISLRPATWLERSFPSRIWKRSSSWRSQTYHKTSLKWCKVKQSVRALIFTLSTLFIYIRIDNHTILSNFSIANLHLTLFIFHYSTICSIFLNIVFSLSTFLLISIFRYLLFLLFIYLCVTTISLFSPHTLCQMLD